jgi:hypothetical protein
LPKKLKVKIDCRNTKFIIDTKEIKKTFNVLSTDAAANSWLSINYYLY